MPLVHAETETALSGSQARGPQTDPSPLVPSDPELSRGRWTPRFGIRSLMLIMLVICVMSACTSYLVKAILNGSEFKVIFVSLTVAAPTMLLVVVSTIAWAIRSMPTRDRG